jgi:hypothetical protein
MVRSGYRRGGRLSVAVVAAVMAMALLPAAMVSASARSAPASGLLWASHVAHAAGDLVVASPDGTRVYGAGTTAREFHAKHRTPLMTAHDAATGDVVWSAGIDPIPGGDDTVDGFAIAPDGSTLYVTGSAYLDPFDGDVFTMALRASTGDLLWTARFGHVDRIDQVNDVTVSRDGGTVVAT